MNNADVKPAQITGSATKSLAELMRKWSGWTNSSLVWGDPSPVSEVAMCDHTTRTFTVNADRLLLNPNKVLSSVTPFRLKQEAVLTGAMLHEAGHARYSRWIPRTAEGRENWRHGDGGKPTQQTVAFARLFEEARVEGLMARDARANGASGLDWTMRASAAHLIPATSLSVDPDQALMDVISSWILRAGRQVALAHWTGLSLPPWVYRFEDLVIRQITMHLNATDVPDAGDRAFTAYALANKMLISTDDTGTTMIDLARDILNILFPETDGDSDGAPMPVGVCSGGEQDDKQGDEGSGDEQGDEQGGASGGGDEGSDDGEQGEQGDQQGQGSALAQAHAQSLAKALAHTLQAIESQSDATAEAEAAEQATQPSPPTSSGSGGGFGDFDIAKTGGGWRPPTKDDRETQKGAERFLRDLIDPSESSKITLTDTPSSMVDGAAMAAWKARQVSGNGSTDPRFFRRTSRTSLPTPPVRIAILVDVSMSMEPLQRPSALLSWALASAALDLRNFAGRGTQVESTLIHWGSSARVIQRNGEQMPGLREFPCREYTDSLHLAMAEVEKEMPGFYDLPDTPQNRLLVNFTDWELGGASEQKASPWINKAMAAGVNMLSIVPDEGIWGGYSDARSKLPWLLRQVPIMRGQSNVVRYMRNDPEGVWAEAAKMLRS